MIFKRVKNDFQKFEKIRSFGREIYSGVITLNGAFLEQINPKNELHNFNEHTKPENQNKKEEKSTDL